MTSARILDFSSMADPAAANATSQQLKILSWNIHDGMNAVEGLKTDDPEFCGVFSDHLIFCFQETKRETFVSNFKCFNKLRAGSHSGGLCIGIQRGLADVVKPVELKTGSEDIQAVAISPFPHNKDWKYVIVNVYDSPEQSSYKSKRRKHAGFSSTLEELLDFFGKLKDVKRVLLVGDFNARTKDMQHEHDDCETDLENEAAELQSSHPLLSNRVSRDTILNPRGKLLMDLLSCTNLTILNGSTLGDVLGEFTCLNYSGSSVVDYMAVSPSVLEDVLNFRILDMTSFSDHRPCSCTLNLHRSLISADSLLNSFESAPTKYKWDDENHQLHQQFLGTQAEGRFKSKIEALSREHCSSAKDVTNLSDAVTSLYRELADEVIPRRNYKPSGRKQRTKKSNSKRIRPKNPWFDVACINAKRKLRFLAKQYGKYTTNEDVRNEYYSMRREYRKLVKQKKQKFIADLSQDIEAGRNINWKRFNQLKKLKPDTSRLDAFDMVNFYNFFKELYGSNSLSKEKTDQLKASMTPHPLPDDDLSEILDKSISMSELEKSIKTLKRGKAVAEDLIANEFLKASNGDLLHAVLHLFNECLRLGVYPWNTSLVTPLMPWVLGYLSDSTGYPFESDRSPMTQGINAIL